MSDEDRPLAEDATVAFGAEAPQNLPEIAGYRVIRALGEGGMGTVYLAEDLVLGRRVAIKLIVTAVARDPAIRARFLREARLLATIDHPNVVRVYSFGATDDRAHLVMEHVEGETLASRIRRGPMAVAEAKQIVISVIDALDAAWEKKIVHRDIKPSNILFDRRGTLKVADFGLAKGGEIGDSRTDSSLTQTGYLLGSPHYVAPEQAQGHEADFRADIYSLGVTLFEMLTGRKPFEGGSALSIVAQHLHAELPSISKLRGDAAEGMADLVTWMTQKNPAKRPSSYGELLDAIKCAGLAVPTIVTKRRKNPRSIGRRGVLAASAVCFLAAMALYVVFHIRARQTLNGPSDDRLVVAIAPFWGPDDESIKEGRSMAALVQQQIVNRLGGAAKVIGIDETKTAIRDTDSARALGERLGATAVIWGQAFALHNEREIQPSVTLIPRKHDEEANSTTAGGSFQEGRTLSEDLPSTPEVIRLQSQSANQIELRKTSAEGIGDLVTFVAAMHALTQRDPQRALDLLARTRRTPDALYQKAICLAQMKRDDDAGRELFDALTLDPGHAPSLAMLADIDARASHFADAAAHLRAAAATGHPFTSSEAGLYLDTLYVKERYPSENGSEETATMLAIDPATDRVLDRWEIPGAPRAFSVDESGMTLKCDGGPPRNGELMTVHFVNGRFQGGPLPHVTMAQRIRRMRPGWQYQINFGRELGMPGVKLPLAHFRYSPIDANTSAPKTLQELKAVLEKAIARDPTQPWYRVSLALATWELGDHASANRIIDEMFARPNRGTAYYEFGWMIRQFEPLHHRDWAERAYAEELKRRRAELQPITTVATFERMLNTPFIRRAALVSTVAPDPPRDHQWLMRAREVTGLNWEGDEIAASAWANYFRAHGDAAKAASEEEVQKRAFDYFGGARQALAIEDIMRASQMAIIIAIAVSIALVFARRRGLAGMARNERGALVLLAVLLIGSGVARLLASSRARLIDSVPVPASDDLGHPAIVATLDHILTERDSDDLRFIAAVAHHLAGDSRRAAELYRSLSSDYAAENLRNLDGPPEHMPTDEMYVMAFHRLCPYEVWNTVKAAWGTRPSSGTNFQAAYEASQSFYVTLILASSVLLLAAGAGLAPHAGVVWPFALFVVAAAYAGIAISTEHSESVRVKLPVSGIYSARSLVELIAPTYPFPPDPTSGEALAHAMAHSPAMRMFWISVAIAVLTAVASGALLAREHLRGTRNLANPLLDDAAEVKA